MSEIELRIHTWPDKILRKKCKKVERVDAQIRGILDKMYYLMEEEKGVGLAANQVGVDLALIVAKAEDRVFKLVNPRIVKKEGRIEFEEGCLSFPDLVLKTKRAAKVWISSLDESGQALDIEAEGSLSVIFQHEIDHINGVLFIDRVPLWKRIELKLKLARISIRKGLSLKYKKA
jgi:peptide deformylase